MARRRPRKPFEALASGGSAEGAGEAATTSEVATAVTTQSGRIVLGVILAVFFVFELVVYGIFSSGEEINWQKELSQIDVVYRDGQYAEAAKELAAFGERWPGAKPTRGWNEKMGLYNAKAGDWKTAATYYARAVDAAPKAPKLHALAGEAAWKAGDKARAIELLRVEISKFDPSAGDHDRANFYLGASLFEEGRIAAACQHFQAIADRDAWSEGLSRYTAELDKQWLQPIRKLAAEDSSTGELLTAARNYANNPTGK